MLDMDTIERLFWELPSEPEAYIWWVIIIYMFYLMSVVCDDFLLPAVDQICERFHIPDDVAGATFVAFACNGPELLTNSVSIYLDDPSVGMGTIVGSAIFNVMVIVGSCPIVAPGGTLTVNWPSFLRDASFSALSILLLAWALPVVNLFKASVLFSFAAVYVLVVAKSARWFGSQNFDGTAVLATGLLATPNERRLSNCSIRSISKESLVEAGKQRLFAKLLARLSQPVEMIIQFTIPDAKVKPDSYVFGFFASMAWLSITAYVVCIGSDRINHFWGVPQSFLGLTLVAVGTSWPNLLASVATARAGRGEIAVSNALGSNVQNVFFVLAFPIWVSVLFRGDYTCDGKDILSSVVWMGASLSIVAVLTAACRFKLRSWTGYVFIVAYLCYILQAAVQFAS